jgi:hypothetical protein
VCGLRRKLGDFLTASPPSEKSTARQHETRQSSADDGSGDKLGSDFTTHIVHGVYIKIALVAQNSRDQVRLGLRDGHAMGGDEGGIVGRSHGKIEGCGLDKSRRSLPGGNR